MSKLDGSSDSNLVPLAAPMGWAKLREELRDQVGWIYRGQQRAAWTLQSTLERAFDVSTRQRAEADLVYRYHQALSNLTNCDDQTTRVLEGLAALPAD